MVQLTNILPLLSLVLLAHATPLILTPRSSQSVHVDSPEEKLEKKFAKLGSKPSTLNLYSTLNYATGPNIDRYIDFQAAPNKCNNVDGAVNFKVKSVQLPGGMSCEFYPAKGCRMKGDVLFVHLEGPVDVGDLAERWVKGGKVEAASFRCRGHGK